MHGRRVSIQQDHTRSFAKRGRAGIEITKDVRQLSCREGHARVGTAVVHTDDARRLIENPTAGENDSVHIAMSLVGHFRREDPFITAPQHLPRVFQVQ